MKTRDQSDLDPVPDRLGASRDSPRTLRQEGLHAVEAPGRNAPEETVSERVQRIRAELASGTYRIRTEQVADKVIEDMLARGRRPGPRRQNTRSPGSPDAE